MSYIRLYPNKNNTLFKNNSGSAVLQSGDINTGMNPIMELRDGDSFSTIVLGFDIDTVREKLANYNYTAKLKLWDAGTLFEPTIKLKEIDLLYFEEDFVEGDGFFFDDSEKTTQDVSNWNFRDAVNDWTGVLATGNIPQQNLQSANEDLEFDISTFINTAIINTAQPKFGVRLNAPAIDTAIYTKYIYSRHTRTMFMPYLEFKIEDGVEDRRHNTIATKLNRIYLKSESGENFVGALTINLKEGSTPTAQIIINPSPGVYYFEFTPTIAQVGVTLFDIWAIDGKKIAQSTINVTSPNKIASGNDKLNGLYFHPATTYSHQLIRHGDVALFKIVSEIRGKGPKILDNYEYRIVCTNDFEMIPWTKASLYNGEITFSVDTTFFYPELEYEIFVRINDKDFVKTSNLTYKFKLKEDGPTHLARRSANPYNNRHRVGDL